MQSTENEPLPSLWSSTLRAWSEITDSPGRWIAASAVWSATVAASVLAAAGYPPAHLTLVLPGLLGLALLRMATLAVRGQCPAVPDLLHGVGHRLGRNLLLALAQVALLAVALLNVGTALAWDGLLAATVVVLACYVAVAACAVGFVTWPVLLDTRRNALPVGAAIRLGLTVVAVRPVGVLTLVLVVGGLAVITVQTVIPALVFPAFGSLLVAHYVLPLADRVEHRRG